MNYQKEKSFWQFLLEVTVFREDEPRPILGATVALGSPFFISGLNRIVNPEMKESWPFTVINNFALKMIPIIIWALIMSGTFYLIYKGIGIMIKKMKILFKETKKEFANELIYHHQHFERQLAKYIKVDKQTRNEEMEKFKDEILKLLNEKLGQPTLIPIDTRTGTVIKNFV